MMQNTLTIGELEEDSNRKKNFKPTCYKFAFSLCSASHTAKIKKKNHLYFVIAQKKPQEVAQFLCDTVHCLGMVLEMGDKHHARTH